MVTYSRSYRCLNIPSGNWARDWRARGHDSVMAVLGKLLLMNSVGVVISCGLVEPHPLQVLIASCFLGLIHPHSY